MFNGKEYKIVAGRVYEDKTVKTNEPAFEEYDNNTGVNPEPVIIKEESTNIKELKAIIARYKSLTVLGKIVYGLPFIQDIITTLYNIYKYE